MESCREPVTKKLGVGAFRLICFFAPLFFEIGGLEILLKKVGFFFDLKGRLLLLAFLSFFRGFFWQDFVERVLFDGFEMFYSLKCVSATLNHVHRVFCR